MKIQPKGNIPFNIKEELKDQLDYYNKICLEVEGLPELYHQFQNTMEDEETLSVKQTEYIAYYAYALEAQLLLNRIVELEGVPGPEGPE